MKPVIPAKSGLVMQEPLIVECGQSGRKGFSLPLCDVEEAAVEDVWEDWLIRDEIEHFPEVSEVEAMRHFVRMSQWNYGVDTGIYPLGSCTMKYNPKINEDLARLEGLTRSHPAFPEVMTQGSLELLYRLQGMLAEISGMDEVTLQPAAGAHGEMTGLMLIRAYHKDTGELATRRKILVPDSAHGTNPASAALCGFKSVQVDSGKGGYLLPETIAEAMDETVAGLMVTNPNTLGIFEKHIKEICDIVHEKGGLIYVDGANLNALVGKARPGDMGFDVIHFNLHKTFSTPHGGGGPGAGPVGVRAKLAPYLPIPIIEKGEAGYRLLWEREKTIGKVKSFYGNFAILVRAFIYLLEMGKEHLPKVAEYAVLNANYIRSRLKGTYYLPYQTPSMHEVIFTDKLQSKQDVTTMEIAKRLLDMGFHAPTVYFPLVVHAALMIEPTETESKESLDTFIHAMKEIASEAKTNPEGMKEYPKRTYRRRLDEVKAAKELILRWMPEQ